MTRLLSLIRHCWSWQQPRTSKRFHTARPSIELLDERVLPSDVPCAGTLTITLTSPPPPPPPVIVVEYVNDPIP